MEKNEFSLLRSKEIIAILDGDKEFGDMTFEDKYGNEKISKLPCHILVGQLYAKFPPFLGYPQLIHGLVAH